MGCCLAQEWQETGGTEVVAHEEEDEECAQASLQATLEAYLEGAVGHAEDDQLG